MLDFVVPIMFLHRRRCLSAWKELGALIWGHIGTLILYFPFQIVLAVVIGVIVFGAVIITCCIAGCLMVLPYLGAVLLLPILMFNRCYSLNSWPSLAGIMACSRQNLRRHRVRCR
jgi:hypothetical protein